MKFTREDLLNLKETVERSNLDLEAMSVKYKEKGHGEIGFLRDVLWLSKWYNDRYLESHTYSALRKILKDLGIIYKTIKP